MKKKHLLIALLCIGTTLLSGQTNAEKWNWLSENDFTDIVKREAVTDLVKVSVTDPVLRRKKQHLRVFMGFLLPLIKINWVSIDMKKHKYVGTSTRLSVHKGPVAGMKEYDVNFDIAPHLPEYQKLMWTGYQKQKSYGRVSEEKLKRAVYNADSTYNGSNPIHCECTPPRKKRKLINDEFYTYEDNQSNLKDHKNFGYSDPSFGVYGAFISDCNHGCHPEIHPYEWIWWIDRNPTLQRDHRTSWMFAFICDDSKRLRKWAPAPRTGTIAIPFTFDKRKAKHEIRLETIIEGKLCPKDLAKSKISKPEAKLLDTLSQTISLDGLGGNISLVLNKEINSEGIKYWVEPSPDNQDPNTISGYFFLAISVKDMYGARITFEDN